MPKTQELLKVAFGGDLREFMRQELEVEKRAVTEGIEETGEDLLFELRQDVLAGGLGPRLARSWRVKHYPGRNVYSLGAASEIKTNAPKIIRAFEDGATVKSADGIWLAIPTEEAPKRGAGRKRISPSNFPEHRFGPLRFIYRDTGPSLLVVENQRRKKGGGYTRSRSKRALKTGYGLSTVIMFTLHRQVRLKRRLNVKRITDGSAGRLTQNIDHAFRRLDAARRKR
ncbi:MAG: DUF6441 family protein [Pelagimonas sp.]|uniref:DUF6441 family protein n=1 Tax=Pelagimonas sp. TaxID=2073170 RepID=UPI003D6A8E94